MFENEEKIERAILVGVHTGSGDALEDTTEETMAELFELAKTAGVEVVSTCIQNKAAPDTATYVGEGKLEEIKNAAAELGADVLIFDDELSPVQVRNISDIADCKVIDRTALILDIFASRAITKEGKIQVELAQLRYMLPRLVGLGKSLSRLGAGIGTRGPGETKLETDRRHIRRRIEYLSEELKEIQKHRDLLRERRKKDNVYVAALVGYTNAGKSTLINLLTDADVLAENKLFATLDPTQRGYELSDGRSIRIVDTVGFIRKLPHHLVKAFRSTLQEAAVADLLIHVIDASNPEYKNHIAVVNTILTEIEATGKPTLAVLNKSDMIEDRIGVDARVEGADESVLVSCKTGEGIEKMLGILENMVPGKRCEARVLIPYSEGSILNMLHTDQQVLEEDYTESGTLVRALVDAKTYDKIRKYISE